MKHIFRTLILVLAISSVSIGDEKIAKSLPEMVGKTAKELKNNHLPILKHYVIKSKVFRFKMFIQAIK